MDSNVAFLRRRNSVPTHMIPTRLDIPIPINHHLQTSSFPPLITNTDKSSSTPLLSNPHDFELVSLRSREYTSLKDLIPCSPGTAAACQSPSGSFTPSCSNEISIRNRLVKQAAWAYLQPMSSSPDSSRRWCSFRQMWVRFSSSPFGFFSPRQIVPTISRAFSCLLGAIVVCLFGGT